MLLTAHFADLARTAAALPAPFPNPETKYKHWFHGTSSDFDNDSHMPEDHYEPHETRPGGTLQPPDRYATEYGEHSQKHWNTDLGVHFSSDHSTAEQFTRPTGTGYVPSSRVAHCALHMANPKHYGSEFDMDREAVKWAHQNGHHYLDKKTRQDPQWEDHLDEGGNYGEIPGHEHMAYIDDEVDGDHRRAFDMIDRGDEDQKHNHYAEYISYHPEREEISEGFKKHLEAKGHDGVVYGNEFEGQKGHPCAIAFHPEQINMHRWEWHGDHGRTDLDENDQRVDTHHSHDPHQPGMVSPSYLPGKGPYWTSHEDEDLGPMGMYHGEHAKTGMASKKVKIYRGLYLDESPELYEGQARRMFDPEYAAGQHWTSDPEVAKAFAGGALKRQPGGTGMVLHGEVDSEHIVDRSEIPGHHHVMSPDHFEKEVYLRPGTPVDVHQTSVHWHDTSPTPLGEEQDDWWDEAHQRHDPPLRMHAVQPQPMSQDDLEQHFQRVFQPQQLEATQERHPKSGYNVDVGEERRLDHVADDVPDWKDDAPLHEWSAPARLKVRDYGQMPDRPWFPTEVGHEPLQHVYRGVTMDEYHQAQQRGYIQSDLRGVIAPGEGTNAATDPRTAVSYLKPGQHGMVLKIKAKPEHDWRMIRADHYVRSANQIPMTDVEHAEPMSKSKNWRVYPGHVPTHLLEDERPTHMPKEAAKVPIKAYHATWSANEWPPKGWVHVGTMQAALDRASNMDGDEPGQSGHYEPWHGPADKAHWKVHEVEIHGRVYPHVLDDAHASSLGSDYGDNDAMDPEERRRWGMKTIHDLTPEHDDELPEPVKGFDAIPYVNNTEDKGSLSYLVHPQGMRVVRTHDLGTTGWNSHKMAGLLREAAAEGYLDNPYHDHGEWFHGTTEDYEGSPDPNHKRDSEEAERAEHSHLATSQFNQLLGTHFSSLHAVAHHFSGPHHSTAHARLYHARLKMPSPAHFSDEDAILHHVWRWASSQHPADLDDQKHNDNMGFQYNKGYTRQGIDESLARYDEGRRSGSLSPVAENRQHADIASRIGTHLQWHPQAYGIARAYTQHLADTGRTGITYGNVVEGPNHHICAIATHPDQIEITHVDKMHPSGDPDRLPSSWPEESKAKARLRLPGEVSHDHIRTIHDEPEDMLNEVERYHNGGMLRSDPNYYQRAWGQGNTGRGEYKYSSHEAGLNGDLPEGLEYKHETYLDAGVKHHSLQAFAEDGGRVGVMVWRHAGPVVMVRVPDVHQRRGIATAMWEQAKQHDPEVRHSSDQSDEGQAWAQHTAGANGDLPEGLEYSVHYRHPEHPRIKMRDGEAWAFVHHQGENIGGLRWNYHLDPPEIQDMSVSEKYRRRGVGTALFNWVKDNHESGLQHSNILSDDAMGWLGGMDDQRRRETAEELHRRGQEKNAAVLPGYTHEHDWLPDHGVFMPSHGTLDPRLFDANEKMRPYVKETMLTRLSAAIGPEYPDWLSWTRVNFCGSEASEWWGGNDFDILLGVNYDAFRKAHPEDAEMSNDEISVMITQIFRQHYNDENWVAPWDGEIWHVTAYVNPESWDIRDIKPYAAYEMITDSWKVKSPHVDKDWGPGSWPEWVWNEAEDYLKVFRTIQAIPDPWEQARRGAALYNFLHDNRRQAFSPQGSGWNDPFNVIWKFFEYHPDGVIEQLVQWAHDYNVMKRERGEAA